ISERSDARAGASRLRLVTDRTTGSQRVLIFAVSPLGCLRRSQYKRSDASKVKSTHQNPTTFWLRLGHNAREERMKLYTVPLSNFGNKSMIVGYEKGLKL